jgi:phage terminase small subunit
MAVRGRKPKPTAVKRATGNPGRRPLPEAEPEFAEPAAEDLTPPAWLSEYEREEWGRIVPELVRVGLVRSVHLSALGIICGLYANYRTLRDRNDFTGARMAAAEYRKSLNEFGLTPASAGRVQGTGADDSNEDPTAKFFGPKLETG